MKLSWTSLKISIAGAKLSHLVQKDKIWDHGSMAEQARIIFYLVQKVKTTGNIASLKKYCSISCFEKLDSDLESKREEEHMIKNPIIKELAIIEVSPGKKNKPDMFTALIKGIENVAANSRDFVAKWTFVRQGDWWLLNEIKQQAFLNTTSIR